MKNFHDIKILLRIFILLISGIALAGQCKAQKADGHPLLKVAIILIWAMRIPQKICLIIYIISNSKVITGLQNGSKPALLFMGADIKHHTLCMMTMKCCWSIQLLTTILRTDCPQMFISCHYF